MPLGCFDIKADTSYKYEKYTQKIWKTYNQDYSNVYEKWFVHTQKPIYSKLSQKYKSDLICTF